MNIQNVVAMVTAGRFLELSVPTTEIQESLEFYLRLGFTELPTNDIRTYYYAVVSDGRIVIGLHGDNLDQPALTFVQPDVARRVRELAEAGIEPVLQSLGPDAFNEAGFLAPDGHLLLMIEARTFSQTYLGELPTPLIGQSVAIILRSKDLVRASVFWEAAGFTLDEESDGTCNLIAPGITIRLDENQRFADPLLRFQSADIEKSLEAIDAININSHTTDAGHLINAPEGTRIILS